MFRQHLKSYRCLTLSSSRNLSQKISPIIRPQLVPDGEPSYIEREFYMSGIS